VKPLITLKISSRSALLRRSSSVHSPNLSSRRCHKVNSLTYSGNIRENRCWTFSNKALSLTYCGLQTAECGLTTGLYNGSKTRIFTLYCSVNEPQHLAGLTVSFLTLPPNFKSLEKTTTKSFSDATFSRGCPYKLYSSQNQYFFYHNVQLYIVTFLNIKLHLPLDCPVTQTIQITL